MLNQLLKFTLISSLLLWLKPRWRGLLALSLLVLLVHVFHGEFISYVELSGDQSYLVWSYVIKWLVLIVGVLVYFYFALPGPGGRAANAEATRDTKARYAAVTPPHDDGFDFLRGKKRLQNRAEKILSKPDSER
jgi:hypothetical protein